MTEARSARAGRAFVFLIQEIEAQTCPPPLSLFQPLMPDRAKRIWIKRCFQFGAAALALWLVLSLSLFAVMCQPPIVFDHVMAKMPPLAFFVLPFETLWLQARHGSLRVGDPAPDFNLTTADRSSEVSLSSFRGEKPVVLIFGSHT